MQGKKTWRDIEEGKGTMYVVYRCENIQTLYTEYTQKIRNPIVCLFFDILFSSLVVSAHLLVCVNNFGMGLFAPKEGLKTSLYLLSFKMQMYNTLKVKISKSHDTV